MPELLAALIEGVVRVVELVAAVWSRNFERREASVESQARTRAEIDRVNAWLRTQGVDRRPRKEQRL
jgi:hypothetical protein